MPIMYPAGIDRRGGSIANNTAVTCHLDSENTLYPLWFLHALCSKNSNKEYKGLHKEATSLFLKVFTINLTLFNRPQTCLQRPFPIFAAIFESAALYLGVQECDATEDK